MSILRSSEERAEAAARVKDATDESLARDLIDWSVATQVSAERFLALEREVQQVRELHAEEELWIELIATEIRQRRTAARAAIG